MFFKNLGDLFRRSLVHFKVKSWNEDKTEREEREKENRPCAYYTTRTTRVPGGRLESTLTLGLSSRFDLFYPFCPSSNRKRCASRGDFLFTFRLFWKLSNLDSIWRVQLSPLHLQSSDSELQIRNFGALEFPRDLKSCILADTCTRHTKSTSWLVRLLFGRHGCIQECSTASMWKLYRSMETSRMAVDRDLFNFQRFSESRFRGKVAQFKTKLEEFRKVPKREKQLGWFLNFPMESVRLSRMRSVQVSNTYS